jgi:hypothetical protein
MIFEIVAGFAALRVIQDSIKKEEAGNLLNSACDRYDWREEENEQKKVDKYHATHRARIEANRKWETEQFGAPCKLDEDGRMIKIDGGILLEDGTVFIDENYKA